MTTILENLKVKQIALRKDRNTVLADSLTTLIGEITFAEKNAGAALPEDKVVKIIRKYADNIRQTRDIYASQDNIQALQKKNILNGELALVETFLPAELPQLSDEELRLVVSTFVAATPGAKMQEVMAFLKANHAGRYDGKAASAIVREELA